MAVRHLGLTHESQALAQYAKVSACLHMFRWLAQQPAWLILVSGLVLK